jgi:WD40 repeat protein
MTANPPSAGRLLVASPAPPAAFLPPPQFSWSPDSKTIALVSGQTLSLLDPTRPAIGPALISNTLASFSWAPVGGRLLLKDNSGSSLVSVDGDLTSAPQVLGLGTLTMWSPDGKYLVTSTNGDLTLIDVTGNTAVTTVVTKRMIPTPSVTQVMFSADSSFLVFAGAQVRAQADVFYVSLKPGIGAPALVSNTLAPMMVAADRLLFVSPDGHWIGYSTTSHNQSTFAAEMVGAKVVAQFPLLLSIDARFAWLPERPQFFVAMAINNAQVFNLPATNSTFFPTGGSSSQSLSPVADVLLWSGNPSQVSLQDLDTQAPATTIDAKLESSQLLWSPDGQFISLLDAEAGGDAIELIRVTGAVPSPRVAIGPLGNSDSVSAWPPVFP